MSDAMASVGIAQNGVIGIGGDGAIGSTFRDLVPLAMAYENTDLVIVAGEIGGCQEELLAQDINNRPDQYPKPLVALISGAHAPAGKTMGHAGAIVTPGLETGTFKSKKAALESAGVTVVNSQFDLITAVQEKLNGRKYFNPKRYYEKMRNIWEAPAPKPSWSTAVTKVEPNNLVIRGYKLQDLINHCSLISAANLIVQGELPDSSTEASMTRLAVEASTKPVPDIYRNPNEDISKTLSKYLLADEALAAFQPRGKPAQVEKTVFCLGRFATYLAHILGNPAAILGSSLKTPFSQLVYRVISGEDKVDSARSRILEAMIVGCIDHSVTPPSVQATRIASSVRAGYEVAVAHGVGAITDVHGGAGEKAALFFRKCVDLSEEESLSLEDATRKMISEYIQSGRRIEGMGHRLHTQDPRRDVMWTLADKYGLAGSCVAISKMMTGIFEEIRGMHLPINVDGVIGAIVADMGLDPQLAKVLFIFGRISGLSAHYFEEIATQPQMRRINFSEAVYRGVGERPYPA
jgi:citrate synthase